MALRSRIVETREAFDSLGSSWNRLLSISGSDSPFMTHEWIGSYWRSFSRAIDPFVVVIESGRDVVGIIPLAVKRTGVLRAIRFLGSDHADYQDLILYPEAGEEAFDLFISTLNRMENRWDVVDLRKLREDSPNRDRFYRYARSGGTVTFRAHDVSPHLKITGSWEAYTGDLRKKMWKDTERQRRRLEAMGALRIGRVERADEIGPMLECYHRQKGTRSYNETVARDAFGTPEGRCFLRDFARRALKNGWLALDYLSLEGTAEPLAISLSLSYGDRFFYWLPSINSAYLAYSPGRMLLVSLLRRCFRENRVEFDFLNGGEPYKYQWLAKDRILFRLSRYAGGVRGLVWRNWVESLRPRLRRSELLTRSVRLTRKMMETAIRD